MDYAETIAAKSELALHLFSKRFYYDAERLDNNQKRSQNKYQAEQTKALEDRYFFSSLIA